jgi:ppGpp synthetase/RelA/SpoT-type nucleotidyltranferase
MRHPRRSTPGTPRATSNRPTPEFLCQQIADFRQERPSYARFAAALKRVFETACQPCLPDAIVQARAKTVSSFVEKCLRKYSRHPDCVHQFTDLCGGRIIVQTLTQVVSVRRFVEENFTVVETEDIGLRLGEKEFGYRDRHYIVQLRPDRAEGIGFRPDEIRAIGERKAELQIRTWAEPAYAGLWPRRVTDHGGCLETRATAVAHPA